MNPTGWKSAVLTTAVGVAVALLLPMMANKGVVFLVGLLATNIVFALSWNLLFSGAGLLTFGHAMFLAAGSYTFAVLTLNMPGVPFLLALGLATVAGGVLAGIIGIVALRRSSGTYFAVLTLAFAALVHIVITKTDLLGRNDGLVGIRRPVIDMGLFSIDLRGDAYYFFIILAMGAAALALWAFQHSPAGRTLQAIRQDPMRAAFLGANVQAWQLFAFVVAGMFAALAGAVQAPWSQIVSPEIAHWSHSTMPVLFTLLGGAKRFWGPALGAVLFAILEYGTRNMHGVADMTTGLLLLIVVLAVPGGVMGLIARLRPAAEGKA